MIGHAQFDGGKLADKRARALEPLRRGFRLGDRGIERLEGQRPKLTDLLGFSGFGQMREGLAPIPDCEVFAGLQMRILLAAQANEVLIYSDRKLCGGKTAGADRALEPGAVFGFHHGHKRGEVARDPAVGLRFRDEIHNSREGIDHRVVRREDLGRGQRVPVDTAARL